MTVNRTSQAVELLKNGMHLKSFSKESKAIAHKYRIMERALKTLSENGVSDDIAPAALAFDPLS